MLTYTIDYIENMPYDGQHQRVTWDLPIDIYKNGYEHFWTNDKDKEESPKKDYWVVTVAEHGDLNFFEFFESKIKQFKDLEKAIEYAHKNYLQWLKKRLEECKQKPVNV